MRHPSLGTCCLVVEVSRLRTDAHLVGLLRTSGQLITVAATYTTPTPTPTSILSTGFELTITAIERLQTYTLET
jgi:hypothetical protein